jgi:hypothetical protein
VKYEAVVAQQQRVPSAVAVAVLATLAAGALSVSYPFGRDQGMFATIGSIWLDGGLPYRDAWDIKPPFVFATYALAELLFGHSEAAIRILDLACVCTTALLLAAMARRVGRTAELVTAAAFPLLYFTGFGFWDTAQAESFALPFIAAAMLLATERRKAFVVGLCLGTAAMFKPTMLLLILPAAVAFRPSARDGLRGAAGLLVPPLVTLAYFAAAGEATLLLRQLNLMRAYNMSGSIPGPSLQGLWPLGLTSFVAMLSLRSWRQRETQIAWAWWFAGLLMVVWQGRYFYYHALPMVAPTTLALGIALSQPWQRGPRRLVIGGAASLAAALLLISWLSPHALGPVGFSAKEDKAIATVIAKAPGSTLWADGFEPSLYFLTGRRSPTRHLSTAPMETELQIPASVRSSLKREMLSDLEASPPDTLVEMWLPPEREKRRFGRAYRLISVAGKYRVYQAIL